MLTLIRVTRAGGRSGHFVGNVPGYPHYNVKCCQSKNLVASRRDYHFSSQLFTNFESKGGRGVVHRKDCAENLESRFENVIEEKHFEVHEPVLLGPEEYTILEINGCEWPMIGTFICAPKHYNKRWFIIFPPTVGKLVSDEVNEIKSKKSLKSPKMVWGLYTVPLDQIDSTSTLLSFDSFFSIPIVNATDAKNGQPLVVTSIHRAVYLPQTDQVDVSVCLPYRSNSTYLKFASTFTLPIVLSQNTFFNLLEVNYGIEDVGVGGSGEGSRISPRLSGILKEIKEVLEEAKGQDKRVAFLLGQMNFEPRCISEASVLVDQIIFATLNELEELTFYYSQFLYQTNVLYRARFCINRIRATYIRDGLGLTPREKNRIQLEVWNYLSQSMSQESGIAKVQRLYEDKLELLPEQVREQVLSQIRRLNPASTLEYASNCRQLDFIFSLPWKKVHSDYHVDIEEAERVLDREHYGMWEVKNRIMELLAVYKLTKRPKFGKVICLVGPPGTGKTTIAEAIAMALNRKFGQISVGGLWDMSDLKGHRKSYVGSMPGLLMKTISRLGVNDPVILFDEVDKVHFSSPLCTALLEVLDPTQQSAYTDTWLDLPFDISNVLFVCTANVLHNIHPALRDRMEIIELEGFLESEKFTIAKEYLIPRALKVAGLERRHFKMTDEAIRSLIRHYNPMSLGLRNLSKLIQYCVDACGLKISQNPGLVFKLTVKNYEQFLPTDQVHRFEENRLPALPGCVNALTYELQQIECVKLPPRSKSGAFRTTGNLDEAMSESASLAYKFVSRFLATLDARSVKDPEFFINHSVHLHYPRGGNEKRGTLAGVASAVALLSLALERPVPDSWAILGEMSLLGYVMPTTDLKSKMCVASVHQIKCIILSSENRDHWDELPATLKQGIETHFVRWFHEIPAILWGMEISSPLDLRGGNETAMIDTRAPVEKEQV